MLKKSIYTLVLAILLPIQGNTKGIMRVTAIFPIIALLCGASLLSAQGFNWSKKCISDSTGCLANGAVTDTGGQVFNVKAYGAVCDGTTNDTAAGMSTGTLIIREETLLSFIFREPSSFQMWQKTTGRLATSSITSSWRGWAMTSPRDKKVVAAK